jgi:hypothetical protein
MRSVNRAGIGAAELGSKASGLVLAVVPPHEVKEANIPHPFDLGVTSIFVTSSNATLDSRQFVESGLRHGANLEWRPRSR